ncbi:MAG: nucleotidyltransferase family protein [Armatimonadota bacterium]
MIDIAPQHLQIVTEILREHVPECEVRAFGSRVQNRAKHYSDLDLAVIGREGINRSRFYRLKEAFEDSVLPFRVDVLDWNTISESFQKVIEGCYEVIQAPTQRVE